MLRTRTYIIGHASSTRRPPHQQAFALRTVKHGWLDRSACSSGNNSTTCVWLNIAVRDLFACHPVIVRTTHENSAVRFYLHRRGPLRQFAHACRSVEPFAHSFIVRTTHSAGQSQFQAFICCICGTRACPVIARRSRPPHPPPIACHPI